MSYYYPPNNPRNNDRNSHLTVDAVFNPRTSKMGTYYSDSKSKSVSSAASFKGRIVSPETPPERTHHYNYNHQQQQQQHSPRWLNIEVPALTLAEKRVVLAQYSHNHGDGGYSHNKILDEYCKFMAIKIMNEQQQKKQRPNNNILCPPKCIDKMWLSHIVCTEEYFAFCER